MAKSKNTSASKAAPRKKIAEGLNQVLADTYALMALTHAFHWNVEGPDFFQLHEAFQEQYEDLFAAADDIAERVRQLEAFATGGLRTYADLANIKEPKAPMPAKDMVAALVVAHQKLIEDAKAVCTQADEAGDTPTEDLMVERLRVHEKTVWMLKSYLK